MDYAIGEHINHVCRSHYTILFQLKKLRMCPVCKSQSSSHWELVCNVAKNLEQFCEAFSVDVGTVHYFDWKCCLCYTNDAQLITRLNSDVASEDPITSFFIKSNALLCMLNTRKKNGIVFTKDVMTEFRASLYNFNVEEVHHSRICNSLAKYISTLIKDCYKLLNVSNTGQRRLGRVIYLAYIYKLKMEEWEKNKYKSKQTPTVNYRPII